MTNFTDNEPTSEGAGVTLPYYVIYVVAIVILAVVSLLVLLAVCMNKRVRKIVFKKKEPPVYVDVLETQNVVNVITTLRG